jgi:serine/threonine protein kinase
VDDISELETALGADLLRANLLERGRPKLDDRYVVDCILGRGASGLVVGAMDQRLGRAVALKLRPVDGDSGMLAEARALARVDHPNVVRVHDVAVITAELGGRSRRLWLVSMARIQGRTMRSWLAERPRSHVETARVVGDIARGLAAAHDHRLVHRDVKPDNVIVCEDGAVQLLDFGFVAPAEQTGKAGVERAPAGTEAYLAPEARGGRPTRKSDQFALGVVLVEALTGRPSVARGPAPAGIPRALWALAARATADDPMARYANLRELMDGLVREDDRWARSARPWVNILVVALVLVLVAASWWFAGEFNELSPEILK